MYDQIVHMWRNWNIKSVSDIEKRLNNFRILFAYNSGKIENDKITYHDTREIFENGRVLNFTGDPRTLFELENQRLCYEYLKYKIFDRVPITVPLILETHMILTAGTYDERRFVELGERPGEFKRHDYVTGREEVGALPENVSVEVNDLVEELRDFQDEAILRAATYFHLRFENIHPFADGNGRVGRTLLNYFLLIQNHPPVIVYDDDKEAYYFALEEYDKSEDIMPMFNFLRHQVELTWAKTLEREMHKLENQAIFTCNGDEMDL